MTKILLIDDEPKWISFVTSCLDNVVVNDPTADDITLVVISDRKLKDYSKDVLALFPRFIVASGQTTTQGAIEAYRLGASRYISKVRNEKELRRLIQ